MPKQSDVILRCHSQKPENGFQSCTHDISTNLYLAFRRHSDTSCPRPQAGHAASPPALRVNRRTHRPPLSPPTVQYVCVWGRVRVLVAPSLSRIQLPTQPSIEKMASVYGLNFSYRASTVGWLGGGARRSARSENAPGSRRERAGA